MSRRTPDAWQAAATVLWLVAVTMIGIGLFQGLVQHPTVAAAWALTSTTGALWGGYRIACRRYDDRMRAMDEAHRRRREALNRPEPPTVADVLLSCRFGRLIGDAERDVVVGALHTHFAAGRLSPVELDERIGAALTSRTVEDLMRVVEGLPSERTGR